MRRYGCTVFRMKSWKDRVSVLCRNGGTRGAGARLASRARGAAVGGRAVFDVFASLRATVCTVDRRVRACGIHTPRSSCVPAVRAPLSTVRRTRCRFYLFCLRLHAASCTSKEHLILYMRDRTTVGSAVWGQQQPPRMRDAPMEHGAHRAPTSARRCRWEEPAPRRDGRKVRHPGHFTSTSLIFTPVASCPIWTAP